jgi:hypothetical protein
VTNWHEEDSHNLLCKHVPGSLARESLGSSPGSFGARLEGFCISPSCCLCFENPSQEGSNAGGDSSTGSCSRPEITHQFVAYRTWVFVISKSRDNGPDGTGEPSIRGEE